MMLLPLFVCSDKRPDLGSHGWGRWEPQVGMAESASLNQGLEERHLGKEALRHQGGTRHNHYWRLWWRKWMLLMRKTLEME